MSRISRPPLLSARTTVVLLSGLVCGAGAGTLAYLGGNHVAAAVLAGVAASGVPVAFFHAHVGHGSPGEDDDCGKS